MGAFFEAYYLKKVFCLFPPPKQMSLLTICDKNMLFKAHMTRLGAIVTRNRGLDTGPGMDTSVS